MWETLPSGPLTTREAAVPLGCVLESPCPLLLKLGVVRKPEMLTKIPRQVVQSRRGKTKGKVTWVLFISPPVG